jgi:mRNA-degrading endonuclease RelE of RelBE toxin-antitoxin system
MLWHVRVANRAGKALAKFPAKDQQRILAALEQMQDDPFSGDLERLKSESGGWRRRVGDYRLLFFVDPHHRLVDVADIARRTTTTYRKR